MKNLRRVIATLALMFIAISAVAQDVRWSHSLREEGGDKYTLVIEAKIAPEMHIYGVTPNADCFPTVINFTPSEGAKLEGAIKVVTPPHIVNGVEEFKDKAIFEQKIVGESGSSVKVAIEYMACSDAGCGMPTEAEILCTIGAPATSAEVVEAEKTTADEDNSALWTLVIEAILWGFAALLTPCVFPMVPMTVSFFTKGSGSPARGRLYASLYGLFIVLLYTLPIAALIIITRIFGGDAVTADIFNWIATHWLPNIIFFVIFMVFAASFFGAFEIVLPSKLVNKSDSMSDIGGIVGAFFMALTLVLVSFSCTGPIVSSVLIKSTQGEIWAPIITMFAFSVAFALPFTLFAFFPSLLKRLPKSGSWLNSVKIVLGFIEVALGFKFLSTADQVYHWGLLDREVYLAIWIVVFSLLGLYLLGKLKFAHDDEVKHISVVRLALAIGVFSFVVYMIPGLWGAPLKALSGYLPPISTQDFVIEKYAPSQSTTSDAKYSDVLHLPHGLQGFFDIEEAEAYAKQVDKPLFIDITGHGCVNCREMESRVWSDATVQQILRDEYVVVALYTDDKMSLPESDWVTTDDGKVLKTLGKKNSNYALKRFNVAAQPYYVLQGKDGEILGNPRGYDLSVDGFVKFLRDGVQEYKKSK